MRWSALLFAAVITGTATAEEVATRSVETAAYASYSQAWNAAQEAKQPMLVILNPGAESAPQAIDETALRADRKVADSLQGYVVAVIDTTTEEGKKVHQLFDAAPLPRIVVIDNKQETQVYRTSEKLTGSSLAKVLDQHKSPAAAPVESLVLPASFSAPARSYSNCPSCQTSQSQRSFRARR